MGSEGFVLPFGGHVDSRHRHFAAQVQRVGHYCSAVKWTDEAAAKAVAAIMLGVQEMPGVGLGYFSTLARLRACDQSRCCQSNLACQIKPSPDHTYSMKVGVEDIVQESALVF